MVLSLFNMGYITLNINARRTGMLTWSNTIGVVVTEHQFEGCLPGRGNLVIIGFNAHPFRDLCGA